MVKVGDKIRIVGKDGLWEHRIGEFAVVTKIDDDGVTFDLCTGSKGNYCLHGAYEVVGSEFGDVLDFHVAQRPESLRDKFAAAALQGMLSYPGDESCHNNSTPYQVAIASYKYADAMLKAREE